MDLISKIKYYYARKINPGTMIPKGDLVIDIGSGDKPFWRANVFLDKLSLRNLHRHSDSNTVNTLGPFIDSDISKTPFRDGAFDYSFCAHLLEHVERPDLAIKEITRISKRGYIEVPNGVIEYISPFHSHLWLILRDKNKLIFYRKGKKLHKDLLKNSSKFYKVIAKINDPFIRLEWNKRIEFEIADKGTPSESYYPPKQTPKTRKNDTWLKIETIFYMLIVQILRYIYGVKSDVDIKSLIKTTPKKKN